MGQNRSPSKTQMDQAAEGALEFDRSHWRANRATPNRATPNRATPKGCYPFNQNFKDSKNKSLKFQTTLNNSKTNLQKINPTIQKETQHIKQYIFKKTQHPQKKIQNIMQKRFQTQSKKLKR